MPRFSLRQLDQKTIALRLMTKHGWPVLRGVGRFDHRALALHICIEDSGGSFEFVFHEELWRGKIQTGESFACDFAIRLDDACNICMTPINPLPQWQMRPEIC